MKASLVQGLEQVRTWNLRFECKVVFGHQSMVLAPEVPLAMMSGARSPLLWRFATATPIAAAVVVNVRLVQVTGLPPLFWYHATPVVAVELLATISRSPSRSRSATARLVTPVAVVVSTMNSVQAPGAVRIAVVQELTVQGFLYHLMVPAVLFASTISAKPSPSMSATQRSFE